MRAGWVGSVQGFLSARQSDWLHALEAHSIASLSELPSNSNRAAWLNCHRVLEAQLIKLTSEVREASHWGLAFEYELPRERGRRVDVAIIAGACVLVLEFKDFSDTLQAHVDQVAAYARDLASYQAATHNHRVIPVLVKTLSDERPADFDGVWITGACNLADCILQFGIAESSWIPVNDWVNAAYSPLPSLVRAARMIFEHEPLPRIRQAESAGVPEAVAAVAAIIEQARARSERHLVLVTGVPGAGKTLTGLQLVYTLTLNGEYDRAPAVFLSGNGPLVAVLQYGLRGNDRSRRGTLDPSRVFVRDVLAFVRDHIGPHSPLPPEHVWVYDEAQRAWDAEMVAEKHTFQMSEPEMFLRLGERMPGWSVMVGLIGSGQEIFRGEERGMTQWNDALKKTTRHWTVHCPKRDAQDQPLAELFTSATAVEVNEALGLNRSLRSHLALDVPEWVNAVLCGRIAEAHATSLRIRDAGFNLYVTSDIEVAKMYVRSRYEGNLDARYGLLASNKDRTLPRFGVRNDYPVQKNLKNHIGPYFVDAPDSPKSCCQLRDVATPFECQGLELDFAIVCWGDDLWWDGTKWATRVHSSSRELDPHRLRINCYRVLMSRGRDGMIIFVPPTDKLRGSRLVLQEAGCAELKFHLQQHEPAAVVGICIASE